MPVTELSRDDVVSKARLIAKECFQRAGGDRVGGLELMTARIVANEDLHQQMAEVLLWERCRDLIADAARDMNQQILTAASREDRESTGAIRSTTSTTILPQPEDMASECMTPESELPKWTPPANEGVAIMARARNLFTEYDYQLWGGFKIGSATVVDLRRDMERRTSRRAGDQKKLALDELLLKRLRKTGDKTKRVQDIVTLDELRKLFKMTGVSA